MARQWKKSLSVRNTSFFHEISKYIVPGIPLEDENRSDVFM